MTRPFSPLVFVVQCLCAVLLATPLARASVVTATYNSPTDVAVTASSFTATGSTVSFTLNCALPTGANLMVVNNTGNAFIQGAFGNLAQGQAVNLSHGGVTYRFVANYFGGTGNDLVLQWANNRLAAWGSGSLGQLGNDDVTDQNLAVTVDGTGVLAGKTVIAGSTGQGHSVVVCSDGTVAAWGDNTYGQLGNDRNGERSAAAAVDLSGALLGKKVVAVSAGQFHNLALCSDGTVAAWGNNVWGKLGNNSNTDKNAPVAVIATGALSGKTVVAVSAGGDHSLALCSDGTVMAWGSNQDGKLGNNGSSDSPVPVAVDTSGLLSGKVVAAVSAGYNHSLALCSDGTLVAWGSNSYGQLGNNSTTSSPVAVAVDTSGALSGKTVVAISAGTSHSLALCSDGTVAAWGYNGQGSLGDGTTTDSPVPVAVDTSGVLSGNPVVAVSAGQYHNVAVCADGSLAAWGSDDNGSLGDGSTITSPVPVTVSASTLESDETFVSPLVGSCSSHNLAIVAGPPSPPSVTTLAATSLTATSATLNATVNGNDSSTAVSFAYGLSTSYGTTAASSPAFVTGNADTAASASLIRLTPKTTYHFRVAAVSGAGTSNGSDVTFTTPSNNAGLSGLSCSAGAFTPAFASASTKYTSTIVANWVSSVTVTPAAADSGATITVNGAPVASGSASSDIALGEGANTITIVVTAEDGTTTKTYTLTVKRLTADVTNPTVAISSPAASARVSESVSTGLITVSGTAADDRGLTSVEASFNGGAFAPASAVVAANGLTARYTVSVSPVPGLNTISVRSTDTTGNISSVLTRTFTYVVLRPLALTISPAAGGTVSVTPALVAGKAQVGVSYTLKATHRAGYFWQNWTASGVSGGSSTTLNLVMPAGAGITVSANFLASPFTAVSGTYNGLLTPHAGYTPTLDDSGFFTATVAGATGAFTGKTTFHGVSTSFSGTFDPITGIAAIAGSSTTFAYALALDLTDPSSGGTQTVTGTVSRVSGGVTVSVSDVNADRATFSAANHVPDFVLKAGDDSKSGVYTVVFKARSTQAGFTSSQYPQGDGVGTVTVSTSGVASLSGVLADGSRVVASAPLSKDLNWPLYGAATTPASLVTGVVAFADLADSDLSATGLTWIRSSSSSAFYPSGWANGILVDMAGALYAAPFGTAALPGLGAPGPSGNATLTFSAGGLGAITKAVNIDISSKVTPAVMPDHSFTAVINASTGLMSGSFSYSLSPLKMSAFSGVILQKGTNAAGFGYFLTPSGITPGQSGKMSLVP